VKENVNYYQYKYMISRCKIIGFYDSFIHKKPRSLNWLKEEVQKLLLK
jgi:hypothetical protein